MTTAPTAHPHIEHELFPYKEMADAIRFLSIDAVNQANSGHPGMPMGMADIATVLFSDFMRFNPQKPDWLNRDRFVLSNGHGSMLLYSSLHLLGYDVSIEDIKNFRQLNSKTPGHPEYGHTPGVETTTGPLGQGIANGVGLALAQKIMAAKHGEELFNNKTYVSVGDGCLMEGISHEAAEFAAHNKLDNLIVLFDSNGISIDGKTDMAVSTDNLERFKAYGWAVKSADGHDHDAIHHALSWAQSQTQPVLIEFKTHIGYGSKKMQDTAKVHGSPLGADEANVVREELGWDHPPFEVPAHIYSAWHKAAARGQASYMKWHEQWEKTPTEKREAILNGQRPSEKALHALDLVKKDAVNETPKLATRQASGVCIDAFQPHMDSLVSGSADLTGSNNTKPLDYKKVSADDYNGNYIHYGVREHAMAAIMNGLSLYGGHGRGLRPISGTFLVFADYLRPSLRLSALMNQPVTYVLTHDSIGLGEDGPTHQPVEHLAMLRATPGLTTWRPCDLVETAECWQAILCDTKHPAVLALSRQGVPTLRTTHVKENLSSQGGYVLRKEQGQLAGIFIATGTEVEIAVKAHEELQKQGIHTRVVSMPSVETFLKQTKAYRDDVLPPEHQQRVVIEAASTFGWSAIAPFGKVLGMTSFGASAPAPELYEHFGLTADHAVQAMTELTTS